jgi:hypothetical protein
MALFDDKQEETTNEVEKIKIGDQEFDSKELEELVGLGKQTREIEQKYNTKMDRVYPEYIKTTQQLKEAQGAQEKLNALEQQIEQQKLGAQGLTEDQIVQAREQLYNIMGGKPLTDKDADAWYQSRRQQEKAVETLLGSVDKLSTSVEKDGKPAFDKKELLEYMDQTGISDVDAAYKIKYEKELDDWKMDKLNKGKRSGLYTVTSSPAGSKQPSEVRPTMANIEAMVSEALSGNPEY